MTSKANQRGAPLGLFVEIVLHAALGLFVLFVLVA